ncbi:MAG: ATP-dependent Clp protease ATP-binding subunit [Fibrobacteraceae bacterium]|nr:ATP-dependent Clp protease ATP-binding subunit [Fibrobacteraceae bacterium]
MKRGNFSEGYKKVMTLARNLAAKSGCEMLGSEFLLLALIKERANIASNILLRLGVDLDAMEEDIERSLAENGGTVMKSSLMIEFSPRSKAVVQTSAEEAKKRGCSILETSHLLLALLKVEDSPAVATLSKYNVTYEAVEAALEEIKKETEEGKFQSQNFQNQMGKSQRSTKTKTPVLSHFGRDLTELARQGKLDPIIGRTEEIERLIQVLSRRKKNNPALIGEPGVGKTAVVEGLAQKIVQKKIPEILENKRVISLDVAAMVAGTKYRGQFEERVKGLIAELQRSDNSIILFIDELHTIVGAGGGADGALDASNIFKPALARGELQCIGATTLDEYRRYIEKDAALERRFQRIIVSPPTTEESIEILNGLRPQYEAHHKVIYTDDAIRDAVVYSERYINERFLPDKAIDILDEAGARIRLNSLATPPAIRELERECDECSVKKDDAVAAQNFELAADYRDKIEKLKIELANTRKEWEEHKKNETLVVDKDTIRDVISQISGVPVTRLAAEETQKLLQLDSDIKKRIIGQDYAVKAVVKAIRRSRAGIRNTKRPLGSFLFLGPTGVGKTELAKVLCENLFGSEESMIRIDMSEYMEKHSISRLIGAPPGYVGFESNGGQLTEKVRKRPYSLILLDEIEKAHPDVYNLLLQILDDGILTDSYGRRINFKNTIIIMTSNVGAREIRHRGGMGFTKTGEGEEYERMEASIRDEVKRAFVPELLNRIDDQIVFRCLSKEELVSVVDIQLSLLQNYLSERGIMLEVSQEAKLYIVEQCYDPALGARPIRRALQQYIEDPIAEGLLVGEFSDFSTITVDVLEGKLDFKSEALPSA